MTQIVTAVQLADDAVRRLEAVPGVSVRPFPVSGPGWDLPAELVRGTEIMLCKFPPRNFDAMADLRLVQLASVGYEHLRDRCMADRPLRVCNARGTCDTAIAEWAVGMMVALTRDLPGLMRHQQQACWDRGARFHGEVRGRVVGLWGYGGIGRETARLAKALGMTVHVLTRAGVRPRPLVYAAAGTGDPDGVLPDRTFAAGQEREFLAGLDYLVLALPHTRQSNGMVGAAELRALPRTAFLLNPARGPIVQEAALLAALREGWIAGAALDTHFAYPLPPEHPLWAQPNVILTPHIAGAEKGRLFPQRLADLFVQNVSRYRDGRPLLNEVTEREWREA